MVRASTNSTKVNPASDRDALGAEALELGPLFAIALHDFLFDRRTAS